MISSHARARPAKPTKSVIQFQQQQNHAVTTISNAMLSFFRFWIDFFYKTFSSTFPLQFHPFPAFRTGCGSIIILGLGVRREKTQRWRRLERWSYEAVLDLGNREQRETCCLVRMTLLGTACRKIASQAGLEM